MGSQTHLPIQGWRKAGPLLLLLLFAGTLEGRVCASMWGWGCGQRDHGVTRPLVFRDKRTLGLWRPWPSLGLPVRKTDSEGAAVFLWEEKTIPSICEVSGHPSSRDPRVQAKTERAWATPGPEVGVQWPMLGSAYS